MFLLFSFENDLTPWEHTFGRKVLLSEKRDSRKRKPFPLQCRFKIQISGSITMLFTFRKAPGLNGRLKFM